MLAAAGGDRSRLISLVHRRLPRRAAGLDHRAGRLRRPRRHESTPGVYVPRWQSLELARRARRLACPRAAGPSTCARVRARSRPRSSCVGRSARVVATDSDVRRGRLRPGQRRRGLARRPLRPRPEPSSTARPTSSWPSCPTSRRRRSSYLPHDTARSRCPRTTTAGRDGTDVLRRVVAGAPSFLRPGGALAARARGRAGRGGGFADERAQLRTDRGLGRRGRRRPRHRGHAAIQLTTVPHHRGTAIRLGRQRPLPRSKD